MDIKEEINVGDFFITANFQLGSKMKYIVAKEITETTINGFPKDICIKVDENGKYIHKSKNDLLKEEVKSVYDVIFSYYGKDGDKTILTNSCPHGFKNRRIGFVLPLDKKDDLIKNFSACLKKQKSFYAGECENKGSRSGVNNNEAFFTVLFSVNNSLIEFDANIKDGNLTINI